MIRLTTLENRFEADLVTEILDREGIDFFLKTFQDTAYDGIFVTQKGYAMLFVEEENKTRAQAIVDEVRASAETDWPEEDMEEDPEEEQD